MRLRLPPTTDISDHVGLIGRGHRTRTLPRGSKTVVLAAENMLMNMLMENELFFSKSIIVPMLDLFRLFTFSGGTDELVCIQADSTPLVVIVNNLCNLCFVPPEEQKHCGQNECVHQQHLSRTDEYKEYGYVQRKMQFQRETVTHQARRDMYFREQQKQREN